MTRPMSRNLSALPLGDAVSSPQLDSRWPPRFRWSDVWRAPLHDFPIRDEILYQYLFLSSDMRVLEVGPGSGITALRITRRVRHLTVWDVAPGNIARLRTIFRSIPNVDFICEDICAPDLASSRHLQYDAAYAIEVLEFVSDPAACIKNLGDALRPGGTLLLQFPNYEPSRSRGQSYRPTRADLDRCFSVAGFQAWAVYALQLRPHANLLYRYLHEEPLRLYRRVRVHTDNQRPQTYDDVWVSQHGAGLNGRRCTLTVAWSILMALMRLGGECFAREPLGQDVLNRNLLILATR
jgi:SAM-dependent methyltransferase